MKIQRPGKPDKAKMRSPASEWKPLLERLPVLSHSWPENRRGTMYLGIKRLHMWWAICRGPIGAISIGTMLLSGCATQSATQVQQSFDPSWAKKIRIEPCVDRSGFTGARDLAGEATRTLTDKLKNAGLFEIAADASIVLTCDIERFAEGSALKRWLVPGRGATQAGISVMLWEKPGDKVLAVLRSQSAFQRAVFIPLERISTFSVPPLTGSSNNLKRGSGGRPMEVEIEPKC